MNVENHNGADPQDKLYLGIFVYMRTKTTHG